MEKRDELEMINTFYKYCLTSSDQSKLWAMLPLEKTIKGILSINIKAELFKDVKGVILGGITQEHSMEGAQFVNCSEQNLNNSPTKREG